AHGRTALTESAVERQAQIRDASRGAQPGQESGALGRRVAGLLARHRRNLQREFSGGEFRAPDQIRPRCAGGRKYLSPGLMPKASYHSSTLRVGPITRKPRGECGSEATCCFIASSRALP